MRLHFHLTLLSSRSKKFTGEVEQKKWTIDNDGDFRLHNDITDERSQLIWERRRIIWSRMWKARMSGEGDLR